MQGDVYTKSMRALITAGIAITFLVSGCKQYSKPPVPQVPKVNTNDDTAMIEQKAMDAAKPYTLKAQNNSGQTGTVKIFEVGGKAEVVLNVTSGAAGVAQPAHIHEGTCDKIGPVVYGLTNVLDGTSKTNLTVPLTSIFNGSARAVNVHKSVAEVGVYVSCADLSDAMMEKKDDTVMDKGEIKTVNLTAKNFAFSQSEIRVKKGVKVTVKLSSTDGFHDWVVDEFNAATARVNTGGSTEVTFTADKAGTFEYYCSVGTHRAMGMKGSLVVE